MNIHLLTTPANKPIGKLQNRIRGFTLTELMIVTMIVAILLAIGVPSYQYVTNSNRIAYEVNDLRGSIELARSEALKRGLTVVLCPSSNGTTCDNSTSWKSGWITYTTTTDCDGSIAAVLKARAAFSSTDTATYTPNAGNNNLCFTRTGMLSSDYAGWFSLNTNPATNDHNRCITISATGQARTVRNGEAISGTTNCS